jgi:2-keto-4-pentenoate hydratase
MAAERQIRAEGAARWLRDAHASRARFVPLPPELAPRTVEEAYDAQGAFVALRTAELGGIAGYKIALATAAMQQFVGVSSPQAGVILDSMVRRSPAAVRLSDYVRLIIEFEIGFELAEDLPAADAPYSRERIARAVRAVMPALELADDRDADYTKLREHPLHLIADNTWNEGVVLGPPRTDWNTFDLAALRGVAEINGKVVGEGRGAEAMGHPLDSLAWVAGQQASLGRALLRGDIVITGSLVTSKTARPGDVIRFSLEGLGSVELGVD